MYGYVAVAFFGHDEETSEYGPKANRFENCIFEGEIAMYLSDYEDERGGDNHGDLSDASATNLVVKSNLFTHCNFIADDSPEDNSGSRSSQFFVSHRGAEDNWFVSCIIQGFDYFNTESTASDAGQSGYTANESETPLTLIGTPFEFRNCCLDNPTSFYSEKSPGSGGYISFSVNDLGDDNVDGDPVFVLTGYYDVHSVFSDCVDAGFDGDWDDTGTVDTDDLVEALNMGLYVVEYFPSDDYDDDSIRTSPPEIGAQEID